MNTRNIAPRWTVVVVLAVGSCAPASTKVCVPNDQKACACLGGVQGIQTCNAEGSAYGDCQGCGAMPSSSSTSTSMSMSTSGGAGSSTGGVSVPGSTASGPAGSSRSGVMAGSSAGSGRGNNSGASSGGGGSSLAPSGPGALDVTFGTGGKTAHVIVAGRAGHANAAALQADGKIVAAGYTFAAAGGQTDFALARYDVNGNLDPTFGTAGLVSTDFPATWNDVATGVGIQSDGKIVATGYAWHPGNGYLDFAVARYESTGTLDATFGTGGKAQARLITTGGWYDDNVSTGMVIQPDGKIVSVGYAKNTNYQMDFALVRWTTTGTLDSTFGVGGIVITGVNPAGWSDIATAVALQSDGKIVVGGYTPNAVTNNNQDLALVRYSSDGSLDTTFGTAGVVTTDVTTDHDDILTGMVLQSDGKIVASGYTWTATGHSAIVARYTANGALDSTFGTGGIVKTDIDVAYLNTYANGVALQTDGKIVSAGNIAYNLDYRFAVLRYGINGVLDTGFGTGGSVTTYVETGRSCIATTVLVQPSGKIVALGYSGDSGSEQHFALARYLP